MVLARQAACAAMTDLLLCGYQPLRCTFQLPTKDASFSLDPGAKQYSPNGAIRHECSAAHRYGRVVGRLLHLILWLSNSMTSCERLV
jgi:hypothetical protein